MPATGKDVTEADVTNHAVPNSEVKNGIPPQEKTLNAMIVKKNTRQLQKNGTPPGKTLIATTDTTVKILTGQLQRNVTTGKKLSDITQRNVTTGKKLSDITQRNITIMNITIPAEQNV